MLTPTTVKFRIAVPSTDANGTTEKVYTLTLSLLVEGAADGDIRVTLEPELPMPGQAPVIPDPPTATTSDSRTN